MENRKTMGKTQCFTEMINKIDKSLATLRGKKKDINFIIRNEGEEPKNIKRTIKVYHEQG